MLFGGQITTCMPPKMHSVWLLCFVKGDLMNEFSCLCLSVFCRRDSQSVSPYRTDNKKTKLQFNVVMRLSDCPIARLPRQTSFILQDLLLITQNTNRVDIPHIQYTTVHSIKWMTNNCPEIFTHYFMKRWVQQQSAIVWSKSYRLTQRIHFWIAETLTHKSKKQKQKNQISICAREFHLK